MLKKKKNRKKGGTPKGHVEICEHEDTENSSSFNNPSPFFWVQYVEKLSSFDGDKLPI